MGNAASEGDADQPCLSFLVRQAWLSMRASVDGALAEHRLTVPQYAALLVLLDEEGISLSEMARVVGATRQSTTELVAGLEREGLVERRKDPADARAHQAFLTAEGRRRVALARPAVQARERELELALSDDQRAAARVWLNHMASSSEG